MRSPIFLGLLAIAFALNDKFLSHESIEYVAYFVVILWLMDFSEFIKNIKKSK